MKPDWDKLTKEYEGSDGAGIFDVDCTAAGKPLCDSNGVRGFPTIKWGDPAALEDYKGGRDYDSLLKFAQENLKPVCSPSNIDLCSEAKRAEIEKVQAIDKDELAKLIADGDAKLAAAEKTFKTDVSALQAEYKALSAAKDAAVEKIKASGLSMMKAVAASKGKAAPAPAPTKAAPTPAKAAGGSGGGGDVMAKITENKEAVACAAVFLALVMYLATSGGKEKKKAPPKGAKAAAKKSKKSSKKKD